MDSWTQYFYEQHSETELKEWASRLNMFRYFRAFGGHANDADSLDVALKYGNTDELITLLNKLGIEPHIYQRKPNQMVPGQQYSGGEGASFPSLIEGTKWIRQPGHTEVFGVKVFVWCSAGVVEISVSPASWVVTTEHVESAEVLEKSLHPFSDIVLDPPRDTKHYLCPKYHPSFFSEVEKPKPPAAIAPVVLDNIGKPMKLDDVNKSSNDESLNVEIYIEGIGAAHEAEHGYRETVVDSAMSLDAFIQYALGFEGAFLASEYYMAAPDLCAVMKKESSGFKIICKQDIILEDLVVEDKPLKVSFQINKLNEAVFDYRMDLLIEKGVKQLDDVEMAWLGMAIGTDVDDLLDELTDFPALQAIIRDGKPAIEEPPKEHWIIKLNFVLRFIRVLISPFR